MKAAFLLNFARYATWPDESFADESAPCVLCVVGDRSIEAAFRTVAGKKIASRKLRLVFMDNPEATASCHMLFISRTTGSEATAQMLASVRGKPVMTVGEAKGFTGQGGMIAFFSKDGRFYFEIRMDIVREQQIKLSSRLLKLAILTGGK